MKTEKRKLDDPAYYLTLFKLEGHETWRAFLGHREDTFEVEQKKNFGKNTPKITESYVLRIDRITGTFSQVV